MDATPEQPETASTQAAPASIAAGRGPATLPRGRRRLLRNLRLVVIAIAAITFGYLYRRYELLAVPEEACSPIAGIEPGTHLLLDTEPTPEHLYLGDLVVYELPTGEVSYARISPPPASEPGTIRTDGGYWLLGDNPTCPIPDSRAHGTFPLEAIAARVLFPLRF
ncbi:MAG: S24/S26 family peptidase [Planctomycetota bacterium]|nr:S24/S26 family peptidase [Planctomycetota bacterium]